MKKLAVCLALLFVLTCFARADDAAPKLKALWCTGGCCHDYKKHASLLTGEISKYASVGSKIVWGVEQFKDKDYARPYDVVVYDLCYGNEKDPEIIGNITRTIRDGKPTVIIHCSLHTFRAGDRESWCEAMGMTSVSHDRFRALGTKKATDHPITKFWPADWKTPGEELYQCLKFWPNATALLTMYSPQSKKDHPVCWINSYGKARVFATTLGHNMLTVGQKDYHRLLANGLLWTCGKLDESGKPMPGYEGTGK